MKTITTEFQNELIRLLSQSVDPTFQANDGDYHDYMAALEELRPKRVRRKTGDGGTVLVEAA